MFCCGDIRREYGREVGRDWEGEGTGKLCGGKGLRGTVARKWEGEGEGEGEGRYSAEEEVDNIVYIWDLHRLYSRGRRKRGKEGDRKGVGRGGGAVIERGREGGIEGGREQGGEGGAT